MILKNRNLRYLGIGALICFILSIFLTALIIKLQSNCFHATDFSIYQEAIYKIAAFGDFNPYIYMRDIKIFNDHFDPIILLASLYIKIIGYKPSSLLVFEYFFFLGLFVVIYKMKSLSTKEKFLFAFVILFTKGILSGLNFPIHPTTWSVLPAFLIPLAIKRNRAIEIISLSLLICLFKESFPFAVLMLGIYYAIRKEKNIALPLLIISIGFLIFNFHFRKVLFGPTLGYGFNLLSSTFRDPIGVFTRLDIKSFFKVFYPFIIPFFFIIRRHLTIKKFLAAKPLAGTLFFITPLLAIQVLANQIHHQYGAQVTAPLLGVMLVYPSFFRMNKKLSTIIVLLFVASGIGSHTKNFRTVFLPKDRFCTTGPKKKEANKKLKNVVEGIPKDKTILATGGVIPMLLTPHTKFYQAGYFSKQLPKYNYLILERNGNGKTMPLTKEFIEKIIPKCRETAEEVLLDDEIFFVSRGSDIDCFRPIFKVWIGARD